MLIKKVFWQEPQAIEPWKGTWEAVNTYLCPQPDILDVNNVAGT